MTSTNRPADEAERRRRVVDVGRVVEHDGAAVVGARLFDTDVDLLVVVDEAEHARRVLTKVGALVDRDLLDAMMGLPRWWPIWSAALNDRERAAVKRAPCGAVVVRSGTVMRMAVSPVRRVLAVVTDADWDHGLNVASRFAPFATRVLVLDEEPAELEEACAEATEYGIGVAVKTRESVRVLVAPEQWRERYFNLVGWLFTEEVYGLYLR